MRKYVFFYLLLILLSSSPFAAEVDMVIPNPDILVHDINDFSIEKSLAELDIELPDFYSPHKSIVVDSTFSFPYIRVLSEGVVYDVCYNWDSIIRYIAVEISDGSCFSTPEGVCLDGTFHFGLENQEQIIIQKKMIFDIKRT